MYRCLVVVLFVLSLSISSFSYGSSQSPLRTCHFQVAMSNGETVPSNLRLQVFDGTNRVAQVGIPLTGAASQDLPVGDYRVQAGGIGANFLTSGPLHVPQSGECQFGITVDGRTDAANNIVEEDVDVEDLRISTKTRSLFQRAFTQLERGDLREAKASFLEVIRLAPRLSRAYNVLGVISDQQGDTRSGRQYFEKALELNPRSKAALMNLAKLSMIERKFEPALALLERYRIGTRDIADVHAMEAEAYLKLGKYNEAIREASAAHLLAHPNWASVHVIAAAAFEAIHQPDFAVREYQRYIEERPAEPMRERAAQRIRELTTVAAQQTTPPAMNSLMSR